MEFGRSRWFSHYWHDLRKELCSLYSRQQSGGAVMVWGGICYNGQTSLAFLDGRQKSEDYQETLRTNLLPFGDVLGGPGWIFQHDNASIYASNSGLVLTSSL